MPNFDTRTPQEPDEPNELRSRSLTNRVRNPLIATRLRTLLVGGGVLWFVVAGLSVVGISLEVLIYSSSTHGNDQKVARDGPVEKKSELVGGNQQEATSSHSSDGREQQAGVDDSSDPRRHLVEEEKCAPSARPKRSTDGVKPGDAPGDKIAFARGYVQGQHLRTDIYVVNPDGTLETRLTHIRVEGLRTDHASSPLAWSPDGEKIAYVESSDGTADIYTIDVDGTNMKRLTNTKPSADRLTGINDPVWSPDGEKIAFQRVYEVQESASASADASAGPGTFTISEIYVVNADGTDLRKLPIESDYRDASSPAWSPDSKKIAFSVDGLEGAHISMINADGTDQCYVTGNSSRPQWLPNGEIAFAGGTPSGKIELYKISADGMNKTRLTQVDSSAEQLSWSPDGERIAYYTIRIGGRLTEFTLHVINADGTGRISVADDIFGSTQGPPSWGGTD
jgi:Tol biopolymer transport system component